MPTQEEIERRHPRTDSLTDAEGEPLKLVRCPDCGQMEWWTEQELSDHGRCRAAYAHCACDE
jgi:hypothetical protein